MEASSVGRDEPEVEDDELLVDGYSAVMIGE